MFNYLSKFWIGFFVGFLAGGVFSTLVLLFAIGIGREVTKSWKWPIPDKEWEELKRNIKTG